MNATGHAVWQVAYSPDSRYLAACSLDKIIYIWEARTGLLSAKLTGHLERLVTIAYSPDGRRLASAACDEDYAIRIWDTSTGSQIRAYEVVENGQQYSTHCVIYSPDGKSIAARSEAGVITILETETGISTMRLEGPSGHGFVIYSPEGNQVASCGKTGVNVWDSQSGILLGTIARHKAHVRCIAYSPDGMLLASGGDDWSIRLWDSTSLSEVAVLTGHPYDVYSIAFSSDGSHLLSSSLDATVLKWDINTKKQLGAPIITYVAVLHAIYAPDGSQVAFGFADGTVRTYDSSVEDFGTDPASQNLFVVRSVACSPDSKEFVSGGTSEIIDIHDTKSGTVLRSFAGHKEAVNEVVYSPNGKLLASGSESGIIIIWDYTSGTQLHTLKAFEEGDTIRAIAFSVDERFMLSAYSRGLIHRWEVKTFAKSTVTAIGDSASTSHTTGIFSPDRNRYASDGEKNTVLISNLEKWNEPQSKILSSIDAKVVKIAFSPDGKHVATASSNNMVQVWEIGKRLEVCHFSAQQELLSVAFSTDGERLACAGFSDAIQQWDPKTGTQLSRLVGHRPRIGVRTIVYTPDGEQLISGSIDGTCRIWSSEALQTGLIPEIDRDLSSLPLTDGWIRSAAGELLLWVPPDYRNGIRDTCRACVPADAPGHPVRLDWSKLGKRKEKGEAWKSILTK